MLGISGLGSCLGSGLLSSPLLVLSLSSLLSVCCLCCGLCATLLRLSNELSLLLLSLSESDGMYMFIGATACLGGALCCGGGMYFACGMKLVAGDIFVCGKKLPAVLIIPYVGTSVVGPPLLFNNGDTPPTGLVPPLDLFLSM